MVAYFLTDCAVGAGGHFSDIEMAAIIFRDVFNDITSVGCCPKLTVSCTILIKTADDKSVLEML
jgi:hypothetical protein